MTPSIAPVPPAEARRLREARKARRRFYPSTVFYLAYALGVLALAVRRGPRPLAAAFFAAGLVAWTLLEYVAHRWVLHGRFADGPGPVQHFLHTRLDHLHWDHHARPWDGEHISGRIQDTLPFALVFVLPSFLAPLPTLPTLVAGLLAGYVAEEWVHHSVHYCRFRNPYFRYIRAHHLYHHSPRGEEMAYGLTSGLWDVAFQTRIPGKTRRALYRRRLTAARPVMAPPEADITSAAAGHA